MTFIINYTMVTLNRFFFALFCKKDNNMCSAVETNFSEIENLLLTEFPNSKIRVFDLRGDGQHLGVDVCSKRFRGLSYINQHRLVMEALALAFDNGLHAVKISTTILE